MDRKSYKTKPQHLVTDARSGEIKRIVHPSDTDIGSSSTNANLRVFGNSTVTGEFAASVAAPVFGHRLSLSSSLSVPLADVPSSTTLTLVAHTSNFLSLYDGSTWYVKSAATVAGSISSMTANKNYDVFVYAASSTQLALELVVWTSDTARASVLGTQDGVYVKLGDATKRYVGTIRSISTTAIADSASKRYVWNYYNRVPRSLSVVDTTDTWTYINPSAVWRQTRATTTNRVEVVSGDAQYVAVRALSLGYVATSIDSAASGVGIDSTTVNSAQTYGADFDTTSARAALADYRGYVVAGYHAINWLETGVSTTKTYTFHGDAALTVRQSGMTGEVMG